ncbi:MAG: response regulator [Lachnospiraceae bacterium]|nr:response regulator [Lachnospiraceae bacterium]
MNENDNRPIKKDEIFQASHLLLLVSYTILSIVLVGEAILLSWELWVLPLIVISVIFCWYIHIIGKIPENYRLWIYTIMLLFTMFFYGIHETSFYDLAPIIIYVIILYSLTNDVRYVSLCQIAYYFTMCIDIVSMLQKGKVFESLDISRIVLHFLIVFMVGYVSKNTIRKRQLIYMDNEAQISSLKNSTLSTNHFLSNLSHEIRTPINAVIGLTSIMLKKERDDSLRNDMEAVLNAGFRAENQIDSVLDYTEIDTGKISVANGVYMISSLINDLITEIRLQRIIDKELIFDIDASMPAALLGDSIKIKKILRQLIENGLKYTKQGGVFVRIFAREHSYGANLCIEVSDTGAGMSETETDRIFDRHYRTGKSNGNALGGLGIGLTIVRGLVKAMGGFIRIDSEINVGTTVSVSIPQKIADPFPCMFISNKDALCLGGYFRLSGSEVPKIREYYNTVLNDLSSGLSLILHRADSLTSLKKLDEAWHFTHVIIGDAEYNEDPAFFDKMARRVIVIAVAGDGFELSVGSAVKIISKPFYCFPVVSILNAEPSVSGEVVSGKTDAVNYEGLDVLVVDDEPMNLLVAQGILSQYGMNVSVASSGIEAIELCKRRDIEVVFMDYMMPVMDGIEAMKIIRANAVKNDRDIVIIALTANVGSSAREMFLSEGFDGFIAKPVDVSELEKTLRHASKRLPSRNRI